MGAFKDLRGQKFGRWMVIERAANKGKQTAWRCRCDCGREAVVVGSSLTRGASKSCGCLQKERVTETHLKDLTGQKYGRLTVLERAEKTKGGKICWLCRCDCGNERIIESGNLVSGASKSCGCLNKERTIEVSTTHGMCHSKIYQTWCGIKARCYNPNNKYYKDYGGRGISIYPAWIDDFQAFYDYVSALEHYGEDGYTLDRINNDGNYEPGNLRWATQKEQHRNTRKNVFVEYKGEQMTLTEAAERSGINYGTLQKRIKLGWAMEDLFRPIGSK